MVCLKAVNIQVGFLKRGAEEFWGRELFCLEKRFNKHLLT